MFTILAIFVHIMFVLTIFKILTNDFFGRTFGYPIHKYVFAPIVLAVMWILERMLKKYRDSMIKSYEKEDLLSVFNTFVIFSLTLVPLVISIFLLKKN